MCVISRCADLVKAAMKKVALTCKKLTFEGGARPRGPAVGIYAMCSGTPRGRGMSFKGQSGQQGGSGTRMSGTPCIPEFPQGGTRIEAEIKKSTNIKHRKNISASGGKMKRLWNEAEI